MTVRMDVVLWIPLINPRVFVINGFSLATDSIPKVTMKQYQARLKDTKYTLKPYSLRGSYTWIQNGRLYLDSPRPLSLTFSVCLATEAEACPGTRQHQGFRASPIDSLSVCASAEEEELIPTPASARSARLALTWVWMPAEIPARDKDKAVLASLSMYDPAGLQRLYQA